MSLRLPEDEALPRALVEAWRGDPAEPHEVQRAYLRFLRETTPKGGASARSVARWVAFGSAIGMGGVYAATGTLHWLEERSSAVPAPSPAVRSAAPSRSVSSNVQLVPQPVLPKSVPAPRERSLPLPLPLPSAATEHWQRAAKGLREKDFATANAALAELARQGTPDERESARLVQAQLRVSQGRLVEAAELLRSLQADAQSAAIREKARGLLDAVSESRSSSRSFEPVEGTNSP